MIKKFLLILFFNIIVVKSACFALGFNDNNLVIPSVGIDMPQQDVQEIINKTQQLESKVESERNSLKTLVDEKKTEYLEAKKNFKKADQQLKAVRSVTKKLQKNF